MKPTGKGKRSILFVAEAPGREEDKRGTQLIGKSGQRLRKELKSLDFRLDDGLKTNAIICRPPKNKMSDLYIDCCRPNILKTIRKLQPSVIVLLGGSAVKALMPTEKEDSKGGIGRWAGWNIPSHEHQAWICPTYHPSFLLRMEDPVLDLLFRQHLERAIELENVPVPSESLDVLKEQIDLILSPSTARKKLKDLAKKKGVLAFDYETTGLKPETPKQKIVSCSFCLDGKDTFAFMMDESLESPVSKILQSSKLKKVAANMKFEERWTVRKLGHAVSPWYWDTVLAAHVLDNRRGITSVKFQAFIYFGIADYDKAIDPFLSANDSQGLNRIHEVPVKELLTYNALDSLLEYKIMEKQREIMYGN